VCANAESCMLLDGVDGRNRGGENDGNADDSDVAPDERTDESDMYGENVTGVGGVSATGVGSDEVSTTDAPLDSVVDELDSDDRDPHDAGSDAEAVGAANGTMSSRTCREFCRADSTKSGLDDERTGWLGLRTCGTLVSGCCGYGNVGTTNCGANAVDASLPVVHSSELCVRVTELVCVMTESSQLQSRLSGDIITPRMICVSGCRPCNASNRRMIVWKVGRLCAIELQQSNARSSMCFGWSRGASVTNVCGSSR
jgi:hypothetical protein